MVRAVDGAGASNRTFSSVAPLRRHDRRLAGMLSAYGAESRRFAHRMSWLGATAPPLSWGQSFAPRGPIAEARGYAVDLPSH